MIRQTTHEGVHFPIKYDVSRSLQQAKQGCVIDSAVNDTMQYEMHWVDSPY